GPVFYFRTDLDAERYRVIAIDLRKPDRKSWKEIVPESKDLLQSAGLVGGKLIVTHLRDAKSAVSIHAMEGGKLREVELPGIGSVGGFGGRKGDKATFYTFSG